MKNQKVKGIYKPETALNWWGRFQHNGQKKAIDLEVKWEGLAADREKALDQYRIKRAEFIKAVDSGIDPNRDRITIKALADEYMELHGNLKKSAKNDETILKRFISGIGGEDMLVKKITRGTIDLYRAKRLKEVSKARVNREIATVKVMFSKAVSWDRVSDGDNPLNRIKMYKEEEGPMRFLSSDEKEALYKEAPGWMLPILKTAILTGMRKGEILSLKWNPDVKQEIRLITVQASNAKSGKSRDIPMTSELYEILKSQPKRGPWVFCDEEGRQLKSYGALRTTFDIVVKKLERAGIPHFRFHDLRHTFASDLVGKGADIVKVQKLMGHSTIGMTMRYAHLAPGHLRETIDLLEGNTDAPKMQFSCNIGPTEGESLPYMLHVSDGESTFGRVAKLADAQDLKSVRPPSEK